MGRHYQILIPLLSIFLVRVDLTDLFPLKLGVKILKVYDGDTVLVGRGSYQWKVRLSRIDAPELNQPFLGSLGSAGLLSRNCLVNMLGDEAQLRFEKMDMYGRILGDLDQVTLKMIKEGCASLYPYAEFTHQQEKYTYINALKLAKTRRRGLWKYGGIMQPKKWRSLKKRNARRH
jgi:endonuclease YncB( thermonuclease family)